MHGPVAMRPSLALPQLFRLPMVCPDIACTSLLVAQGLSDLSDLPSNTPDLLSAPTATTPAFIAVSLAFTVIFFLLFTLTAFRGKMGKMGNLLDKPSIQRTTAWIGLLGFLIGKRMSVAFPMIFDS